MICRGFLIYNEQKTSKKQQHPHFFSLFFSLIKKGCKCITTQTPKTKKYSRLLQKIVAKPLQRYKIYPIQKRCSRFTTPTPPEKQEFVTEKSILYFIFTSGNLSARCRDNRYIYQIIFCFLLKFSGCQLWNNISHQTL